jgi:hypothetical protein
MSASPVHADWKRAVPIALILLGVATFVIFVIRPGGFESQLAWFFGLLPGALLGEYLGSHVSRLAPDLDRVAQWGSIFGLSFLWYFLISYGLIKIYRSPGAD